MNAQRVFSISLFSLLLGLLGVPSAAVTTGQAGRCTPDWSTADLAAMGMISVTDTSLPGGGATPDDDADDDTSAIQEAVFRAMEACVIESADPGNRFDTSGCKTVYFPPGTYHVSDTIHVLHPLQPADGFLNLYLNSQREVMYDGTDDGVDNGTTQPEHGGIHSSGETMRRRSNVLVGSTCGITRPSIALKDGSVGFDDAATPKALVHFYAQCRDAETWACGGPLVPGSTLAVHHQATIGFNDVFRGIDIDVSGGHPGAIGLSHAGAQGAAIEDVTINADGAHAGIEGIPGQGGGAYNVRIDGGQDGVATGDRTAFGLLVGVKLFDQTGRAINHMDGRNPLVTVGFHIRKSSSTGGAPVYADGGLTNGLVMVSGLIDAAQTAAIDTGDEQAVYLRNVYVQDTGPTIVGTPVPLSGTGQDQRVIEWSYTPAVVNEDTPQSLETGIVHEGERIGVEQLSAAAPPSNVHGTLVAPHIWGAADLPSFEDTNSVIVLPGGDIQSHLDAGPDARVFLGGGRHTLSSTLELGANDRLAGLARARTVLETSDGWATAAAPGTPIVHAAADPSEGENAQSERTGTAALGRLSLQESTQSPVFTHTRWNVGRHSTLHGVIFGLDEAAREAQFSASEKFGLELGPNGGGRAWGYQPEGASVETASYHPDYRHVFGDGSAEPLSIYGLNCEKAHSDYTCEFRDATDIDVYMLKSETCHQCDDVDRPATVGGVFTGGDDNQPGASGPTDRQPIMRITHPLRVGIFGAGGNAAPTSGSAAVFEFSGTESADYVVAVYGPATDTEDTSLIYEDDTGVRVGNAATADTNARMVGYARRVPAMVPAVDLVVDNRDPAATENPTWWTTSSATTWEHDSQSRHWGTFRWTPELEQGGSYTVYAWWNHKSYFSTSVPYQIRYAGGLDTVYVNQRDPTIAGQWNLLGTFEFDAGNTGYVEISAENGTANADAVRFVLPGSGAAPLPTNDAPTAHLGASVVSGESPLAIQFDGSSSSDPDGAVDLYHWDFDDGTTGSGVTVNHIFSGSGLFEVTLTVTDDQRATGSESVLVEVFPPAPNVPPTAEFDADPVIGEAPLSVAFDASSSQDTDGTIAEYDWNFGDGTGASGVTVAHTFSSATTFEVILTVTDDEGATDTTSVFLEVLPPATNVPPTADFDADPVIGEAPLSVAFDASSSQDTDGTIAEYDWDFGDGTGASGVTVAHTFSNPGTLQVTLTVTDDDGATDSTSLAVETLEPDVPPVEVIVDNRSPSTTSVAYWWTTSLSTTWDRDSQSHHWGRFKWWAILPQSGSYSVYAWWNARSYFASNVPYRVQHAGGVDTVIVDQRDPANGGRWVLLGTFTFDANGSGYVEVSAESGIANADAVRFVSN